MSWTPEQRRGYAPAIDEAVRTNATVRLAATIDVIDPPARAGRPLAVVDATNPVTK